MTGLTRESESPKLSCTVFEIFENFQNKKTFQKWLKYSKIFLCLISIWLSKCNTFNQVQSHEWIRYSLNIDMCDVCGYQRWDSPQSNVKFQWSIQPRHTQLARGRVTNFNYRSMHIWPPIKLEYIILKIFIWLYIFYNIWSFWNNTSHFDIDAWNFWYFNLISKPLAFGHHTLS